jgi:GMP synthase (glutamine-hydrolysing)
MAREGDVRVLSVMHSNISPAGLLGDCVLRAGGSLDEVNPIHGDPLPDSHEAFDGLLVLGGAMAADDDANHPHYSKLLDLIRGFHGAGKPAMGVCLGAQFFARAFGGTVRRHHELEIGFTPLRATEAGLRDLLLGGLSPAPRLMQWHQDTFDLPPGAELLLTGERCRNQAFRLGGSTYAFQCHLETTKSIVRSWVNSAQSFLERELPDFPAEIERQMAAHQAAQTVFTRALGERWVALAGQSGRGAGPRLAAAG